MPIIVEDNSTKEKTECGAKYDKTVLDMGLFANVLLVRTIKLLDIDLHACQRLTQADQDCAYGEQVNLALLNE